jgi:hypothetical protein
MEVSIEAWVSDVLAADSCLRGRFSCTKVSWFGLRVGSVVAALASVRAKRPPDKIILWDPVLNGAQYLDEVASGQQDELRIAYPTGVEPEWAFGTGELLGFELPAKFEKELREIRPLTIARMRATQVAWLSVDGSAARIAASDKSKQVMYSVKPINWSTDEALNSPVVPRDVIESALQEITAK